MACLALVAASCAARLAAQDGLTAARVTEPGRTIERALDLALAGRASEAVERTLMVVVDPSEALATAGFVDAFVAALAANQKFLARTEVGLGLVGSKGCVVVSPTMRHDEVVAALRQSAGGPSGLHNVYESVRDAAAELARAKGERTMLLVTLENGDLEDDVEKTAQLLRKAKIGMEVLTSEATLADCYWQRHGNQQVPTGTALLGGDGALVDVPWGFLFQREPANEMTPSGYAAWGLNRLAAATEGRVFLYASSAETQHQCAFFGTCLFCDRDHELPDAGWNSALVSQVAPLVSARDEALKELGADPCFRLVMRTWQAAAKEGLIESNPAVRVQGTSAAPDRARAGRDLRLLDPGNFERSAKRAEQAAKKALQLRQQLAAAIAQLPTEGISPRARASAEYLLVLLQLTRVNLVTFVGFCREYAPKWFDARSELLPPELPPFDADANPAGIFYENLSLCHGVRPFHAVELPGGEELRQELLQLEAMFNSFQHRYGKGQFGYALRRNGIARFHPVFLGVAKGPVRKRPKSGEQPKGPTTPVRPTRRGGSSSPAGGPTTGGGE